MNPASIRLLIYYVLLLVLAVGRLLELKRARHNQEKLLARGAKEFFPGHYPWMVMLHGAWFLACGGEAYLREARAFPWLPGVLCFLVGLGFRLAAMQALKERWTTRILVLPREPLVRNGPYRYLRHPNYLGVVLEILGLPLMAGCWVTALTFTVLNAILLTVRIRDEERAFVLGQVNHGS